MATARINLTVDKNTKEEALKLFDALGLDASTAVNMFFKSVVRTQSIPFDVSIKNKESSVFDMSSAEFMQRVQGAVDNRNDTAEAEFVVSMDLNENKPYRMYRDGRREYID